MNGNDVHDKLVGKYTLRPMNPYAFSLAKKKAIPKWHPLKKANDSGIPKRKTGGWRVWGYVPGVRG